METTKARVKLEELLIREVSGVDYPANELDGWLIMKAAGAGDSKVAYADPGLQEDGKSRYPIDTEEHVRAAWGYINQADNKAKYSDADYTRVRNKIRAAMVKLGADVADEAQKSAVTKHTLESLVDETSVRAPLETEVESVVESFVGKIKAIFAGASRKEDIEMTKEEMNQELDERFAPITETLKTLSEAIVEKPAAPETPEAEAGEVVKEEAKPSLTAEDVEKAVSEGVDKALEPVLEILDKTLDRLAAVEGRSATRKSLDGQETNEDGEVKEPTVGDAIKAAANGRVVELR